MKRLYAIHSKATYRLLVLQMKEGKKGTKTVVLVPFNGIVVDYGIFCFY